jgi:hypothetical protein
VLCSQKLLRVTRAFFSDAGETKELLLSWPRLTILLGSNFALGLRAQESVVVSDKNDLLFFVLF